MKHIQMSVTEKNMKEKKEGRVRKTLDSQVRISTKIRSLEVHRVLVILQHMDQPKLPVVRLFYLHRQLLVHQEVLSREF